MYIRQHWSSKQYKFMHLLITNNITILIVANYYYQLNANEAQLKVDMLWNSRSLGSAEIFIGAWSYIFTLLVNSN